MSRWHVERALFHLAKNGALLEGFRRDPQSVLRGIELDDDERDMIDECDVAEMYRRGVHPNLIRNYSATVGVDYVARYRDAGL